MNWYKQAAIEKFSIDWKRFFRRTVPMSLASFLLGLGIADVAFFRDLPPEVAKQQIEQKAQEQGKEIEFKQMEPFIDETLTQISEQQTIVQPGQSQLTQQVQTQPVQLKQIALPEKYKFDYVSFAKHLSDREGIHNIAYDDKTGLPVTVAKPKGVITIGIGHAMGKTPTDNWARASQKAFQETFGDSVNWLSVFSGKQKLNNQQIQDLAKYDINKRLSILNSKIPNLNRFPQYVQSALLDGFYRGDLGPATISLINKGEWRKAADEYINREDYKNAIKNKMRGIKTRMDANRAAMLQYAKELNR